MRFHTAHSCSHEVSQAKRADEVFSVSGGLALLKRSDNATLPAYLEHNISLDSRPSHLFRLSIP